MSTTEKKPKKASKAEAMREALAEDREIRRLEAEIAAEQTFADELRAEAEAAEDAVIAAELEEADAAAAEMERRAREEPPGSLMHAAREARARGLDYIPEDLFKGLTNDALREMRRDATDLYFASLAELGSRELRARVGA